MAFWQKKNGKVCVYTWDKAVGKQKAVPRQFTKHLDNQPDSNIETWVKNYELTHEGPRRDLSAEVKSKELTYLLNEYLAFLASRGKRQPTISGIRNHLSKVLAFFESVNAFEPEMWPNHALDLWQHFQKTKASNAIIRCSNIALRGMWKWLVLKQSVTNRPLSLVSPIQKAQKTPLQFTVTPTDILNFSLAADDIVAFLALAGFFFSLRPQESYALTKSDFVAGPQISDLGCSKAMSRSGLYNKLAVKIEKQLASDGLINEAKKDSAGWVACFNEDAAKRIVAIVNRSNGTDRLCRWGSDHLNKIWAKNGYPGITLKDLRRASLYWLGHNTEMTFSELKNHARHTKAETTALYIRRPDEIMKVSGGALSLD